MARAATLTLCSLGLAGACSPAAEIEGNEVDSAFVKQPEPMPTEMEPEPKKGLPPGFSTAMPEDMPPDDDMDDAMSMGGSPPPEMMMGGSDGGGTGGTGGAGGEGGTGGAGGSGGEGGSGVLLARAGNGEWRRGLTGSRDGAEVDLCGDR